MKKSYNYLTLFFKAVNKKLLILALFAFFHIFMYELVYMKVTAPNDFIVSVGKVFYSLAFAIVGGWIFYFITTEWPTIKDRNKLYPSLSLIPVKLRNTNNLLLLLNYTQSVIGDYLNLDHKERILCINKRLKSDYLIKTEEIGIFPEFNKTNVYPFNTENGFNFLEEKKRELSNIVLSKDLGLNKLQHLYSFLSANTINELNKLHQLELFTISDTINLFNQNLNKTLDDSDYLLILSEINSTFLILNDIAINLENEINIYSIDK